jgi:predicted AAA+ superfamily ATPase
MEILNNSKFAVEFFTILQDKGNADPIYSDSKLFFKKTFLTQNMDI